jgi:hypothetical protein
MKNYNQELDDLFDMWEKESEKYGLVDFCRDGLLNKGNIFSQVNNEDGKTYWGRERGNESELWHHAEKRILFLMKETNGNPGEDMRYWIGRQHPTTITNRFFKNIALWFYGLTTIQVDGTYIPFEKANNQTDFSKSFDNLPISIVNLKKESGGARVSNDILLQYVGLISDEYKKYGDVFGNYLRRQVAEILNPNIIVCGGGSGTVLRIAREIIYPKLIFTKVNNWIYYNKASKIILIDSYHPTHTSDTDENVYEVMMKSLQQHYSNNYTER